MSNTEISIDYFLVQGNKEGPKVEVLGLSTEEQEDEAERKIKEKISNGLYQKGKFSEETTMLDRFDDNEQGVIFPAIVPRSLIA